MFVFLLIALVVVIGAVTLAVVGGRDTGPLADVLPDRLDAPLPPDRPLSRADVEAVRLPMTLRGYRMADVDDVLGRLGAELAERDARIAELEDALAGARPAAPGGQGPWPAAGAGAASSGYGTFPAERAPFVADRAPVPPGSGAADRPDLTARPDRPDAAGAGDARDEDVRDADARDTAVRDEDVRDTGDVAGAGEVADGVPPRPAAAPAQSPAVPPAPAVPPPGPEEPRPGAAGTAREDGERADAGPGEGGAPGGARRNDDGGKAEDV